MVTSTFPSADVPQGGAETVRQFLPVPERVSQYLELKSAEVAAEMQSAKGRQAILAKLLKHEDELREEYPGFDPKLLEAQLNDIGEALAFKGRFADEMAQKKGTFRRALEGVGGFVKRNPITSILLLLAAATGTVAAGAYAAGGMEALLAKIGLSHLYGAEGAAAASAELGSVIEGAGESIFPDVYSGPTMPDTL